MGFTGWMCLCAVLVAGAVGGAPRADFFVATNGRDTWSGRLASPNRARTDGPFATLDRARAAVRPVAVVGRGATVLVRGGLYHLASTLAFAPEDSGTPTNPVVYGAYPGEKPVLSGGVQVKGWQVTPQGWWETLLPGAASGKWCFTRLYVGDQSRMRTRLPEKGYYTITGDRPAVDSPTGRGFDSMQAEPGRLRSDWHRLQDVEVVPLHIWTMSRFRVREVDNATGVVRFTGHTSGDSWWASMPKGNRFLVENVREALGKPGQWYLDRGDGRLTYVPMPGEKPGKTVVVAPRLGKLMRMAGRVSAGQWVTGLVFRGLSFEHANWDTPEAGRSFPQAEADLGAAVELVGARDVVFDHCNIRHAGEYGLEFGDACRGCRAEDCELTDLGAGGIKIGTTSFEADEALVAGHNTVRNCLIAHGGRLHPAGIGVWIGHSPYNTISHNEIADFYYTGISVGWSWGYGPSNAHHNLLEYNLIHHIGQGVLSDMGGTYTLGIAPGSMQRGNVIHDVDAVTYGGWGIYFDEGTTGMVAEDNLVYRTKAAGFHQHYGRENVVRNNIFAFGREAQLMRTRAEEHLSFTMERNIVYWTEGPLLGSNWSGDNYKLDHNLYWNPKGGISFAGMDLKAWQAKGQDRNSLVADPGFANPAVGDFTLKPGGPASQVGFVPFKVQAGRVGHGSAEVVPIQAFPTAP